MRLRMSQNCPSPLGDAVAWLSKACSVWGWAPPFEQFLGQAWTPGLCASWLSACVPVVVSGRGCSLLGWLEIMDLTSWDQVILLFTGAFFWSCIAFWSHIGFLFHEASAIYCLVQCVPPSASMINAILIWITVYYFWIFEAASIYAS